MSCRRVAAAVVAAALTGGAAVAQTSAPVTPPPAAAPQVSPQVQMVADWAARASAWVANQQNTFIAEERALAAVNAGAAQAMAFQRTGKAAEGAAWALQWAAARRLELSNLAAAAHDAGADAPPLPDSLADIAELKVQGDALRALSRRQAEIIRVGLTMGGQIVDLAQKAASGDADAASKLPARRDDLAKTILKSENLLVEASGSTRAADDPETDLGQAQVSGNLAMIALIDARRAAAAGDAAALKAAALELRARAGEMKAAALKAPAHADARLRALRGQADFAGTPLASRVEAVLATFKDSADVESQIAEALLTVATDLEQGEGPSSAGVQGALAGMNPLLQRRVALDLERKNIIAGRPS
jgi:hypothetical protein